VADEKNMIGILQRYLITRVIFATLTLLIVVGILAWVINFLGELKDISGDYGFLAVGWHALLELPYTLSQFFPMLALLGGLLGLGGLAQQGELIVMRASGLSLLGLVRAMLLVAIILSIINFLIGEVIAPRLHYLADTSKSSLQSSGQAVITASGVWFHQKNDFIHVEKVMKHQRLEGVTRYEFDANHRLLSAGHADNIEYRHRKWIVHNLARTFFSEDKTAHSEFLTQTIWDMQLNPMILNASLIEPEEISLNRLFVFIRHLNENGSQISEFQFSFWKRVLQPFTILLMLWLAIPFVLAAPRSAMGWRLLLGVIIGFVFYMLDIFVGQLSVILQFSPILAAFFPILLFILVGFFGFTRLAS